MSENEDTYKTTKFINAETGAPLRLSDSIDTRVIILSPGEEFDIKSAPVISENAITGKKSELASQDSVIITDSYDNSNLAL